MREIKFRGKRQDNGEWVYGGIQQLEDRTFIIVETGFQSKPNDVNGPAEYDTEPVFHEVDPETVGEYTALKDKNNIDVYEGDVCRFEGIQFESYKAEYYPKGEVNYSAGQWFFGNLAGFFVRRNSIEIISNPELLK